MKLNVIINTRNGRFPDDLKWQKYYKISLPQLHQQLQHQDWCESTYDNESNNGGASYIKVNIKKIPQNIFSVTLNKNFTLKFNVYSNGKLMIWERGCGKHLPEWFDEFFTKIVFFTLKEIN